MAVVNWIGGDGDWGDASNWDTGIVPGDGDQVVIDQPGEIEVTISSDHVNVESIHSNEPLRLIGGSLTIEEDSSFDSTFVHTGGQLSGDGDLSVGGFYEWLGGTVDGNGKTVANGGLLLSGSTKQLRREMHNAAAAEWIGGRIDAVADAVFQNLPEATFTIRSATDWISPQGTSTFINKGTVVKSDHSGEARFISRFDNRGAVQVDAGLLHLGYGGGSHSGDFTIAAGAELQLESAVSGSVVRHTLSDQSDIVGSGSVLFGPGSTTSAGTINVAGNLNVSGGLTAFGSVAVGQDLVVDGGATFDSMVEVSGDALINGTLGGNGITGVAGQLVWTGDIVGPGTVNAHAGLQIDGVSTKSFGGTINSLGLTQWKSGKVHVFEGAQFNNLENATFEIHTGQSWATPGPKVSTFNNHGSFKKMSAGPTRFVTEFNNHNSVDVEAGLLHLGFGGGSHTGDFAIAKDAELQLESAVSGSIVPHELSSQSDVIGEGSVIFGPGSTISAGQTDIGGDMQVLGGVTLNGDLAVGGDLAISGGATLNSTATVQGTAEVTGALSGIGDVNIAGELTWVGSLFGSGLLNANGGIQIVGEQTKTLTRTVNSHGTATWLAGEIHAKGGAEFNNNGVFNLPTTTRWTTESGQISQFNNLGSLHKDQNNTSQLNTQFTNFGRVEVAYGELEAPWGYSQTGGTTELADGRIVGTTQITGGAVIGSGSIDGMLVNAAHLRPDGGDVLVNGHYIEDPKGMLTIDLGGSAPETVNDKLVVTGSVSLSGELKVEVGPNFAASHGHQFVIINNNGPNPVEGTFAGVSEGDLIPAGNTQFQISYAGGTHQKDVVLQVINQPPGVPVDLDPADDVVLEGSEPGTLVGVTAFAEDPDGQEVTYALGDGSSGAFEIDSVSGVIQVKNSDLIGDDAVHIVVIEASDGVAVSTVTKTIEVKNAPPIVTKLSAESHANRVTLSGSFFDMGETDTHHLIVDWGDGELTTVPADSAHIDQDANAFSVHHSYQQGGIYQIQASVVDDDHDTGAADVETFVAGVRVVNGVLQVVGSDESDRIRIFQRRGDVVVSTRSRGERDAHYHTFAKQTIDSLHVETLDGNDTIIVSPTISLPTNLQAGAGNDVVFGGSGDDRINGGEGNDRIRGRRGHDELFGGPGNDWIWGGSGDDYLDGGEGRDRLLGQRGNDELYDEDSIDFLFDHLGSDSWFRD